MSELSFTLHPYRIPLSRPLPVGKQRISERQGLVLVATLADTNADASARPLQAFADIAPLSGLDMDGAPIMGFSQESLDDCREWLLSHLPGIHSLEALEQAADTAPLPAVGWGLGVIAATLQGQLPAAKPKASVPLMYLQQDEPVDALTARVARLSPTTRFVKIKVAQTSMETELKLVHGVLAARPDLKLRLDANQGFSLEQAIDFCACLPADAIDYIEEPCLNEHDHGALFRATGIHFSLDESLSLDNFHFPDDVQASGLRALILKPMLLGSPARVQALIDEAHERGLRCVISSSLESSLGIDALARFAAAVTPDEAPGLDTLDAFEVDCVVPSGKARRLMPDAPSDIQGAEIGASLL
ncbi:o-succinylbenzoate synthase [Shewanella sp. JM162201]|uniref:o-succinylbenzoate synthase n=1 Tax=Shewanella jiangmenensis TaxID=2837387 RepID=A0ABS5V5I4_9GAMM|nr:o-succinylbenzoate synthase [Shewanella jiangmenensis]MBT1445223.1 o-succinylbenzoate synthase [Shewanella jiangmenensis]